LHRHQQEKPGDGEDELRDRLGHQIDEHAGAGHAARRAAAGELIAIPALAAFYVIQRRSGHRLIEAALSRFAAGREWRALGAIEE
jgi:hypothetical protein